MGAIASNNDNSTLTERLLQFMADVREYLTTNGVNVSSLYYRLLSRIQNPISYIRKNILYIANSFKTHGFSAFKVLFSTENHVLLVFTTTLFLLYSINMAFFGVQSKKFLTIYPLVVFIIFSFLEIGSEVKLIHKTFEVMDSGVLYVLNYFPAVINPLSEAGSPGALDSEITSARIANVITKVILSMLVIYLIAGAYFILKYVFFFYGMFYLWNTTVEANPDKSIYFYFFIFSVLALFLYMRLLYLLELLVNSFIFSAVGSLMLVQFLSAFGEESSVADFMDSLFSSYRTVCLTSRFTIAYGALAILCFVIQLHSAMEMWTNHHKA